MLHPLADLVDLVPDDRQRLLTLEPAAARALLLERPQAALELAGSFALTARDGERVVLARSLDRPLRYFLAKQVDGPLLVVAERIDEIAAELGRRGLAEQFHPSYTRMAPAHVATTIRLVGCPDPNPTYVRCFDPPRAVLPPDLDLIGERYVTALYREITCWLGAQDRNQRREPIGVCFSGGVDSGAVLFCLYRALLAGGQSPARLKACTLEVGSGSSDRAQAREFLCRLDLVLLLEVVAVDESAVDPLHAVEVIEDYKQRDVECAAVALALVVGIRHRYPEWRLLVDGDGGDENLKDYPIEENHELTLRSVVSNRLLYHEGWGIDAIKHSLTYSGGLSRGVVRTFAPLRRYGFVGYSPFMAPAVIAVAEAIPFAALAAGEPERLYALKGEVVRRGIAAAFGVDFPVFPKRRFQHGALSADVLRRRLGHGGGDGEAAYRSHFLAHFPADLEAYLRAGEAAPRHEPQGFAG